MAGEISARRSGLSRSLPWLVLAAGSRALFEALLPFVLVRSVGVEAYGAWEVCKTIVLIITPLGTLGFHLAYVEAVAAETDPARRAEQFRALMVVGTLSLCVCAAAVLAAAPYVGMRLLSEDADYRAALLLSTVLIPLEGLSIYALFYWQARRAFRSFALASAGLVILDTAVVLGAILFDRSISTVVGALVGGRVVRVVVMHAVILRTFPRGRIDFGVIRAFLAYGVPLLAASQLLWLIKLADRFILADARPLEEVGMYALLFNIANVVFMVALPFQAFIYPTLAKAHGEADEAGFQLTMRRCFEVYNLLALPAGVGVVLLLTPLLHLLQVEPASWPVAYSALLLLLAAKYAYSLVSLLKFVSATRGRSKQLAWMAALSLLTNLAMNLYLAPRYGMLGASIASCVSITMLLLFIVSDLHRFGMRLHVLLSTGLAPATAVCVVMAAAVYPLRQFAVSWPTLGIPAIVGGIVYGMGILVLVPDVRKRALARVRGGAVDPMSP